MENLSRNEVIKNVLLSAEQDGIERVILYNDTQKDYAISMNHKGNIAAWEKLGYSTLIGKIKFAITGGKRKAELFDEMLGYLVELISDKDDLTRTLKNIGFTEAEIKSELD